MSNRDRVSPAPRKAHIPKVEVDEVHPAVEIAADAVAALNQLVGFNGLRLVCVDWEITIDYSEIDSKFLSRDETKESAVLVMKGRFEGE